MKLINIIRRLEDYYRTYGPGAKVVMWCDRCHTWTDELTVAYHSDLGLDKGVNAVVITAENAKGLEEPPFTVGWRRKLPPFWKRVLWNLQRPY